MLTRLYSAAVRLCLMVVFGGVAYAHGADTNTNHLLTKRLQTMSRAANSVTLCTQDDNGTAQCATVLPQRHLYFRDIPVSQGTSVALCNLHTGCDLTAQPDPNGVLVCFHCACQGIGDCIKMAIACGEKATFWCIPTPTEGPGEISCICKN